MYKSWHENGFVTLYVNRTSDQVLEELVIFDLENLEIDGLESEKQVFVRVGPGEEQLIKINMIDNTKERKLSSKCENKKIYPHHVAGNDSDDE